MIFAQIFFVLSVMIALFGLFYQFTVGLRERWYGQSKKIREFAERSQFMVEENGVLTSRLWEPTKVAFRFICLKSIFYRNTLRFSIEFDRNEFDLEKLNSVGQQIDWFNFMDDFIYWEFEFWLVPPNADTMNAEIKKRLNVLKECRV